MVRFQIEVRKASVMSFGARLLELREEKLIRIENGYTVPSIGTLEERMAAFNRSGRIGVSVPVTLCVDSDGKRVEHPASTIDLSNKGARICASMGLIPGQSVTLITEEGDRCSIPGRVVWVGPVGSRLEGHAGIEFLHRIPALS